MELSLVLICLFLFLHPASCQIDIQNDDDPEAVKTDVTVQNVHLAFAGSPSEMVVSWLTIDNATSIVKFGLKSGAYTNSASGESISYAAEAGWSHHVKLTGLTALTKYYYICGDGTNLSPEYNFITSTLDPMPFVIGMYGDMGVNGSENTIQRVIERVSNKEWNWIYHVGDISYADDHLTKYQEIWNDWFHYMQPALGFVPYMVNPGNHEYTSYDIYASKERGFSAYNNRFRMPGQESGSNTNMWFSFDYSNVHFVSISTETDFPGAPPREGTTSFGDQMSWLEADLKAAYSQRSVRPWVIVCGHRPMYSSSTKHVEDDDPEGMDLQIQAAFEPLFNKYAVDIFVMGHVHNYERMYPVYNDTATAFNYDNPKATIHLLTGAGGNIEGLDNTFQQPPPSWSAFSYGEDWGYSELKVHNNTHLTWTFYRASDNYIVDTIEIVQENHPFQ